MSYAAIGLHHPKNHHNIGGVLRAAGCFGASLITVSGTRYRRAATDTNAVHRSIPLLHCVDLHDAVPYDCVPVAVDLIDGAIPLPEYAHPARAFYIFGPEDGTLGASITKWCRDVVSIPSRHCLNLAATVNVVLYDRVAKGFTG